MKGGKSVSEKGSKTSSHVVSFRLSNEAYRGLLRVSNNLTGSPPAERPGGMFFAYPETGGDVEDLALPLAIRRLGGSLVGLKKEVKHLWGAFRKRAARPPRKS